MANEKPRMVSPPKMNSTNQHQNGRETRYGRTAQGAVQGIVNDRGNAFFLAFVLGQILTNPVKYHNGIVHGITHNGKQGTYKRLVNVERERQADR